MAQNLSSAAGALRVNACYQMLQSSCYKCHRMNVKPLQVHLFVNQCRLIKHGKISLVPELANVFSQSVQDEFQSKEELAAKCRETVTEFTEEALKGEVNKNSLTFCPQGNLSGLN